MNMDIFDLEQVWPNFQLTDAEATVIREQSTNIRFHLMAIEEAAGTSDGKSLQSHYHAIQAGMEYMTSIFGAKMHAAVHATRTANDGSL